METAALVIELRSVVGQPHTKAESEIRDLAEEYADKCRTLNRRLAQAVDFLRKGYRGEAVRLTRLNDLVSEASTLSFPEREFWVEIATVSGVTTVAVSIGLAKELDNACETCSRVQPLVDKLRLLNVRRASADERVAVLQDLRRAEPDNRMWQDGLDQLRSA